MNINGCITFVLGWIVTIVVVFIAYGVFNTFDIPDWVEAVAWELIF